jgi:hypothetical protein
MQIKKCPRCRQYLHFDGGTSAKGVGIADFSPTSTNITALKTNFGCRLIPVRVFCWRHSQIQFSWEGGAQWR